MHLNGRGVYHAADVDWLIARVDEQIADHEARSVAEKAASVEYFRRAREILLSMRTRANDTQSSKPDSTSAAELA